MGFFSVLICFVSLLDIMAVSFPSRKSSRDRAAHLLNSQAVNLDVVDVCILFITSFLSLSDACLPFRSFRSSLQTGHLK